MEGNLPELRALSQYFVNTLSPLPELRRQAEVTLSDLSQKPGYGLTVLNLVAYRNLPEEIRQAASVNFKNHLKARWAPASKSEKPIIQDAEKEGIKTVIVNVMLNAAPNMLNVTPKIHRQLSEALGVIGKHDFPRRWTSLLEVVRQSLVNAYQINDFASLKVGLSIFNPLLKKFRNEYLRSNPLLLSDLEYCLVELVGVLTSVVLASDDHVQSAAESGERPSFDSIECYRLCCRIFFSLNFQGLSEHFMIHESTWVKQMKCLQKRYPRLEESADGLVLLDALRTAVFENINLMMRFNHDDCSFYLNNIVPSVWDLLMSVSQDPRRDRLAFTALNFLTTVSSSVQHDDFGYESLIPSICSHIVIPNVRRRAEDEELFEMNYIEFIRRDMDMEWSDVDSRRRMACELLNAMYYQPHVKGLVPVQIHTLMTSDNWKDRDCAIHLVVSLATKMADVVDVLWFFEALIVPELQTQDVNVPMLKAGALKFFTMFRNHIPRQSTLEIFPDLIQFLRAKSNVVHSYAASCIEKLLLVKDESGQARYTSVDISQLLPQLMNNLFEALNVPESEENQYVMKCLMRVLGVADISLEIVRPCITGLTSILNKACENPHNPVFDHYVFESVAVLVKRACGKDASLISVFEINLFPSIQKILVEDVQEFYPYAFQLLAQLVELYRPPIPQSYMQIFPMLLSIDSWRNASNVPALVRLLQAFIKKAPHELNQEGSLRQVLQIYSKLISSSSTDEQGFCVLNMVVESLDFNVIAPYIGQVWTSLFRVLEKRETPKLIKCLLISMSLVLVKHGSTCLVESVNSIQADLFMMILKSFWIPNLTLVRGVIETKLTAVASTRLLCEAQMFLDAAAGEHWGNLLNSIVTLLSRAEKDRVEEDPEMPEFENVGYSASFIRLHNAGKTEDDPLKDVRDAKEHVVTLLARLIESSPERYLQIISQYVEPANQEELVQLLDSYNILKERRIP